MASQQTNVAKAAAITHLYVHASLRCKRKFSEKCQNCQPQLKTNSENLTKYRSNSQKQPKEAKVIKRSLSATEHQVKCRISVKLSHTYTKPKNSLTHKHIHSANIALVSVTMHSQHAHTRLHAYAQPKSRQHPLRFTVNISEKKRKTRQNLSQK